jgi:alpha-tubulin suppressor-like RCC1 family protein
LNSLGQIGNSVALGFNPNPSVFQIAGLSGIVAIATKNDFSLFLKNDGTVWTCGDNQNGQLGNGTANTNPNPIPTQIPGLTGVIAISAGNLHSLFLKNDGTLWACGYNGYGNLGDGTTIDKYSPVQVNGLCQVLGIEENENSIALEISPNPFSTQTTVQITNDGMTNYELKMFDVYGREVKEFVIRNSTFVISREGLKSGVYFLQVSPPPAPSRGGQAAKLVVVDE